LAITAYDVGSGSQVWSEEAGWPEGELRVAVDPTGRWFGYARPPDRRLRLLESSNSLIPPLRDRGTTPEDCEAISPIGSQFAGSRRFFPDPTGAEPAIQLDLDGLDLALAPAFSPDGRLLAWGTEDGLVFVADLQRVQRQLATLGTTRTD